MHVKFPHLIQQFAEVDGYLEDIKGLVETGDFTLGKPLIEFEQRFAHLCNTSYAIGVKSGTDALFLSLKVLGVGSGDEVITSPTTFIATIGAIMAVGAYPIFVDSADDFLIDVSKIEKAITPKTKAIIPVHYAGNVANMPAITEVARQHGLFVIEDACQSIAATFGGRPAGSWGEFGCFSLHPLKNLNVWGDGGMITTNLSWADCKLRLYRNHGLVNRDVAVMFGYNARLDTLQAVIGNRLMNEIDSITDRRIAHAERYNRAFANVSAICIPARNPAVKHVYHLYIIRTRNRDELLAHLHKNGVEAKIHYPIPIHLQPAAKHLGYKEGDFPTSENIAKTILSLPMHQHLESAQVDYVANCVRDFYRLSHV